MWYWLVLACNVGVTQLLWFKRIRTTPVLLFGVSILINIGMWTERFMIVIGSLAHEYLPATWGIFTPTVWDWAFLLGTLGLFTSLMFLFVRLLPIIPAFEMRRLFRELWLGSRG
jgi:Ni/Fe-hydrogenase subunit HybB-like protein